MTPVQRFAFFPVDLLKMTLSECEIRVLIAMYSFRDKNANTIWPSIESIADRAGITDKTRVSKITSKLVVRGLITKKKRGFSGGNIYGFVSNLDESANLDESSCANLDESAMSNLDESAKCKELPIELTNELPISCQAVVDLYHAILPELPKVKLLTDARKTQIKTRSAMKPTFASPDFWEAYFESIRDSAFHMGQNERGWKADFDWLTNKTNFVKMYEKGCQ